VALGLAISVATWSPLIAQSSAAPLAVAPRVEPVDHLDFDRPEAWAIAWATSVTALRPMSPALPSAAGRWELGVELARVPGLSDEESEIGFGGTKRERLDRVPAFARLRARTGLGHGLVLELGLIPPVELRGMKPLIGSIAVEHRLARIASTSISGRLGFSAGRIEGDITCEARSARAGDDPVANPFGCEAASRDRLDLRTLTLGLMADWRRRRVSPFVGALLEEVDGAFHVDARYAGIIDRTRLETRGSTWILLAGLSSELAASWRLATEVDYTPLRIRRPGRDDENRPVLDLRLLLARAL